MNQSNQEHDRHQAPEKRGFTSDWTRKSSVSVTKQELSNDFEQSSENRLSIACFYQTAERVDFFAAVFLRMT